MWLNGEPFLLAEYTGTNAGIYFYLNDHLGTPQQLLNGNTGAVAWHAAYLPFGEAQILMDAVTNNLRFPGQYYDMETGLYYNWNRYYDPKSGRYISTDPIGQGIESNLYVYGNNDYMNLIDPQGLMVLPNDPSGLDPKIWKFDTSHRHPRGVRYREPSGRPLDFHYAQPNKSGFQAKSHWHDENNFGRHKSLAPGQEIPDPAKPIPIIPSRVKPPLPLPFLILIPGMEKITLRGCPDES